MESNSLGSTILYLQLGMNCPLNKCLSPINLDTTVWFRTWCIFKSLNIIFQHSAERYFAGLHALHFEIAKLEKRNPYPSHSVPHDARVSKPSGLKPQKTKSHKKTLPKPSSTESKKPRKSGGCRRKIKGQRD